MWLAMQLTRGMYQRRIVLNLRGMIEKNNVKSDSGEEENGVDPERGEEKDNVEVENGEKDNVDPERDGVIFSEIMVWCIFMN